MNAKIIGYWVATGLVALGIGAGGVFDLLSPPEVVETMKHLGYGPYVAPMLGVWKLLGTAALLSPGFPLVKEWAYAGIVFDLIGAFVSHAAVGDPSTNLVFPVVLLGATAASWALRPPSRTLWARAASDTSTTREARAQQGA